MSVMDFSFTGEWTDQVQSEIRVWVVENWTTIAGESPDQDFVEYVMVREMILHKCVGNGDN